MRYIVLRRGMPYIGKGSIVFDEIQRVNLPLTLVMVTQVMIGRTILGINDEFSSTLSEQFCVLNSTVKHCDFYEVERPAHIIKFPLTIFVLSRYAAL